MGLVAHVADVAGLTVTKAGTLELIASNDVGVFLSAASTHNVAIMGIEGFRIAEGRPIPDMDAIADFSNLCHTDRMIQATIEEARRFITEVSRPDMYFDFSLSDGSRD